jgi:hypothetical protein
MLAFAAHTVAAARWSAPGNDRLLRPRSIIVDLILIQLSSAIEIQNSYQLNRLRIEYPSTCHHLNIIDDVNGEWLTAIS